MGLWTYDAGDGDLLVLTEVEGPAARLGHALRLRWHGWRAQVSHADGVPTAVRVTVPVEGIEVVHGEGGLKGLSSAEKAVVRRRALKELRDADHPRIELCAETVEPDGDGWLLRGTLRVAGRCRACVVRVARDGDLLRVEETVRQSDFGVRPVRFLGGAFSVADEVRVRLAGVAAPVAGYDAPTG